MADLNPWTLLTFVALAAVTVITRGFFFLSDRPWQLPHWAERGLQYAPIAALAAVVVPEVVMQQGQLIHTWQDARLYAAVAGAAWFFWRGGVLGTIVTGMAVYLPLHLGLGW
ncbi:Branched-chain amino acid transport protein (AzlD) [Tepidimonas fonticaldi]|uniref:Branched-chain amino acid transport protein (AzlD) n=1 Tax=Tepidimonas fonticaldi TaxID=1101373 RepID=A0A1A6DWN6_9BURK|nr:AzlD domain-containing protein [Tepidimonas fonticaldi]OBS31263.1 branched-chain amino acid transporter [Tepidimonas fonticaldi]TSE36259.1 Branched-chain amino acid transport protein (AzlD) [Tepidimonas fonticaldi]